MTQTSLRDWQVSTCANKTTCNKFTSVLGSLDLEYKNIDNKECVVTVILQSGDDVYNEGKVDPFNPPEHPHVDWPVGCGHIV